MNRPVPALECLLSAWEEFWYLARLLHRSRTRRGRAPHWTLEAAAVHAARFRTFLLGLGTPRRTLIDPSDFCMPGDFPRATGHFFHAFASIACNWCATSRRVHKVSSDLQLVLESASLGPLIWDDVDWQFPSFALELETPITDGAESMKSYSFIIATTFAAFGTLEPMLNFMAIPDSVLQFRCMSRAELEELQRMFTSGPHEALEERLADRIDVITQAVWGETFTVPMESDAPVTGTCEALFGSEAGDASRPAAQVSFRDRIMRLAVGASLHLRSLPPSSAHAAAARPPLRSGKRDKGLCFQPEEVCTVASVVTLSAEERALLTMSPAERGSRMRELGCHFREAHWRRPPGRGADASAERTVYVRFTIVRRDRVLPGTLPPGSEKHAPAPREG